MNEETLHQLADLERALLLLTDHLDMLTVEVRKLNTHATPSPARE